jgi:hypothetical protein
MLPELIDYSYLYSMISGIVELDDEAALIGSEKVAEIDEQFDRPNNSAESHVVLPGWTSLDTSL